MVVESISLIEPKRFKDSFTFEKYKSQVVENQTAIIGYIKNGEMIKGEEFKNLYGEYNLTIDEMENITYKLDRGAKINVIISP